MEEKRIEILTFTPDKADIEILYCLFVNGKNSSLQSFKIKDIIDNTELRFTYGTYIKRIKKLLEANFIYEGFKDGNAKCYYISQNGINYLENSILSKENIFEYEDEEEEN